jgi:hypothetical protein
MAPAFAAYNDLRGNAKGAFAISDDCKANVRLERNKI